MCVFRLEVASIQLYTALFLNPRFYVGFEVLTAVVTKSTIFWDITPCSRLIINRRFGRTYRLRLQGFFLSLFFGPEDGGDMFLRNVGWHSTEPPAFTMVSC
jgi:hypothetical protein